jgi:hypothetical protein
VRDNVSIVSAATRGDIVGLPKECQHLDAFCVIVEAVHVSRIDRSTLSQEECFLMAVRINTVPTYQAFDTIPFMPNINRKTGKERL